MAAASSREGAPAAADAALGAAATAPPTVTVSPLLLLLILLLLPPPAAEAAFGGALLEPSPVLTEASGDAVGRHGDPVGKVSSPPYVLAVDGTVFVSEFWTNRVVRVDSGLGGGASGCVGGVGAAVVHVTVFAAGGGLDGPWGLAAAGDVLLVASFATDRIHRFRASDGEPLGMFGHEDEIDCPEGLAVGADGNTLFVASFLSDTVAVYSIRDGRFLASLAPAGLKGPEDVAVLPSGDVIVTSHYTDEILRLPPPPPPGRDWPTGERVDVAAKQFASVDAPVGVTVGLDGHVYAASYTKHAIVRFDGATGRFVDYFATGGFLQGPSSLSFASTRLLFVSSYENDRLVLYNASARASFTVRARARGGAVRVRQ